MANAPKTKDPESVKKRKAAEEKKAKKQGKGKGNSKEKEKNGKKEQQQKENENGFETSHSMAKDNPKLKAEKDKAAEYVNTKMYSRDPKYLRAMEEIKGAKNAKEVYSVMDKYFPQRSDKEYGAGGYKTYRKEAYTKGGKAKVIHVSDWTTKPKPPEKGTLLTHRDVERIIAENQPTAEESRMEVIIADARFYAPKGTEANIEKKVREAKDDEEILQILAKYLRPEEYHKMEFRIRLEQAMELNNNPLKTAAYGLRNVIANISTSAMRARRDRMLNSGQLEGEVVTFGVHGNMQLNSFEDYEAVIDNFLSADVDISNLNLAADQLYSQIKKAYVDGGIVWYNLVCHSMGGEVVKRFNDKYVKTGKINPPRRVAELGTVGHVAHSRPMPENLSIGGTKDVILNVYGYDPNTVTETDNAMNVMLPVGHTELLHDPRIVNLVDSYIKMGPDQSFRITQPGYERNWSKLTSDKDPSLQKNKIHLLKNREENYELMRKENKKAA